MSFSCRRFFALRRGQASSLLVLVGAFLFAVLFLAQPAHAARIDSTRLYNTAAPGVVLIYSTGGQLGSQGAGSVIDPRGLVLTNTHVVTHEGKDWPKISVFLKPSRITGDPRRDLKRGYRARVVAKNPQFDLALLQIIGCRERLRVLPLSDLSSVGIGEPVVAIGHPGGGAPWSLTTGTIGASFQNMQNKIGWHVFQTETALNPGNSGGPLLDGSGAVIGVNTFIRRRGRGGLALVGLNFAVKSSTVRTWIVKVMGSLPTASEIEQVDREQRRRRIAGLLDRPADPAPVARAPIPSAPRVAAAAPHSSSPAPAARAPAAPAARAPTPAARDRAPAVASSARAPAPAPAAPARPRVAQKTQTQNNAKTSASKVAPLPSVPRTVSKDGAWTMKARKHKRKLRLVPSPRRPKHYTSTLRSGMTFGGDKLRALLNKRSEEAFDELDRALGR